MRKRKTYTPAQKLRAALDLIKGDHTAVDIARDIGCHPTVIVDWKEALEKNGTLVFEHQADETRKEAKIAKLGLLGTGTIFYRFTCRNYTTLPILVLSLSPNLNATRYVPALYVVRRTDSGEVRGDVPNTNQQKRLLGQTPVPCHETTKTGLMSRSHLSFSNWYPSS